MEITDAKTGLKDLLTFIKSNELKVVTVDPKTGTFMMDGFMSTGMEDDGRSRMIHKSTIELTDLGFCKIFMDPTLTEPQMKYVKDGKEESLQIEFNGIMLI